MPGKALTIEQVLSVLDQAPQQIGALTAGLTPAQLLATPSREEWSANEVLAHLRACADVWGGCIMKIVSHEADTLRAVNPRTWIKQTDYLGQAFRPSLRAFRLQRTTLMGALEPLTAEVWAHSVTVTGAGKAIERTALDYGQRMARHERSHIRQIQHIAQAVATTW
jgi:DinB superfamily